MFTKKARVDPWIRIDNSILSEIWEAIWKYEKIRLLDVDNFSVSVKKGIVQLCGHINRENNLQLIEKAARSVAGVVAVENNLVVDRDLTIWVAEALARDEHTRPYVLAVGCIHGWVSLDGEVPTCELQSVAEEVAAQVSCVRGVVSLPSVTDTPPEAIRRAVQPRIDTPLYGEDGQVGVVSQVVIQPRNRLVTQVIASDLKNDKYLVPVEALGVVNKESGFLNKKVASLCVYPLFDPSGFLTVQSDWRPPYPYTAQVVLWPADGYHDLP
ncbi:MAG TPA: BON domain-containing protein [Terriglobia bacterium]|nr:BON domain-containing protein [Terriglobia bacterium]